MGSRARVRGVSLIELMIALVISLVLIGGAIQVYVSSRKNYDVNEGVVRLQENARYALSILEPDIRMANSWGLLKGFIEVPSAVADTENCDPDLIRNVTAPLDGGNNEYTLGCTVSGAGAMATADTLIIRRASVVPSIATGGRLLVCSTRTQAQLVQDSTACTPAPTGQVNDMIVNGYFINRDAKFRAGVPTLSRFEMITPSTMANVEILPGVEDMQVQFGIDPTGSTGVAARYVNPGEVPANAQVVSVRLWLLMRAETPEQGFTDNRTYEYGDRAQDNGTTADLNDASGASFAYYPQDSFRRLLVSRTILIRNAVGI